MKRFLLATVSMVALTSVGRAADLPVKGPMYSPALVVDWSGLYLGIQGGVVRRDSSVNLELGNFGAVTSGGTRTGATIGALVGWKVAGHSARPYWPRIRFNAPLRYRRRGFPPC
jgi:opacity protein-like surface antigen